MVHVGDKVTRVPRTIATMEPDGGKVFGNLMAYKPMKGEVIYIHPKGRFHVVEFTNAHGITMRETFWGIE